MRRCRRTGFSSSLRSWNNGARRPHLPLKGPDLNDLTAFTLAEARDALNSRAIDSEELTRAHLIAIERAKALNAYVAITSDQAIAMARASDARRAKGEAG